LIGESDDEHEDSWNNKRGGSTNFSNYFLLSFLVILLLTLQLGGLDTFFWVFFFGKFDFFDCFAFLSDLVLDWDFPLVHFYSIQAFFFIS
jgi:hypothetical protein